MAAKRVIRYRGQTIRVWDRSYSINNEPNIMVPVGEPDVRIIKQLIDERIASQPEPFALEEPKRRDPTWRERLFRAIELRLGMSGDLHRQTFYAWRDYPDAMKLTIALFFALGSLFACVALIVGAWALGK